MISVREMLIAMLKSNDLTEEQRIECEKLLKELEYIRKLLK